jgi:hypothetical protein
LVPVNNPGVLVPVCNDPFSCGGNLVAPVNPGCFDAFSCGGGGGSQFNNTSDPCAPFGCTGGVPNGGPFGGGQCLSGLQACGSNVSSGPANNQGFDPFAGGPPISNPGFNQGFDPFGGGFPSGGGGGFDPFGGAGFGFP